MKLPVKSRYVEILIAVTFVVLLVYIASVTIKVTRGVSKTIEPPGHQVRLQVLNGCGVPQLAARVADQLAGYSDADLDIVIVDTDNFTVLTVDSTFVISRDQDKRTAKVLARKLGLPDNVVFRPLEDNYRHVSVTLVLGTDYERIRLGGAKTEGTK